MKGGQAARRLLASLILALAAPAASGAAAGLIDNVNGLTVDATWGSGLDGYADGSLDAIVTNPPFHQGVAKDSSDTLEMFDGARRVLRRGGKLWCVFNSHLPYRKELNVRVGRTQIAAQDPRYTVTVTTVA